MLFFCFYYYEAIDFYFYIRHDYSFYMKHLDGSSWIESGSKGHIVSIGILAENISDNIISDINRLPQLSEIHVRTVNPHTRNENVINLSLLNNLNKVNTLFLRVGEQSAIQYLELPKSINTIVLIALRDGTSLDDNELKSLAKFTYVKTIYIQTSRINAISDEGITAFKNMRQIYYLNFLKQTKYQRYWAGALPSIFFDTMSFRNHL